MFSITEANALAADPDLDTGIFVRSDTLKTKTPPIILYFFGRRAVCSPSFSTNRSPKIAGTIYIFCLEGGLVSPKRVRNTGCAALWRIFSSNKSVPANRKKGFFGSRLPKNEEIRWTVPLTNQVCLWPHLIYMYTLPSLPSISAQFSFLF